MQCRRVPLSFPGMRRPTSRSAPSRSKSDGSRRPPGSAGVPPACYAVACRSVSLRFCTPQAGAPPQAAREMGAGPPGARASRPHAMPSRAAQFPCDVAPGHPDGGNGMGPAEADPCRRCRSNPVEEMVEAVPGRMRAGRPRSRVGPPSMTSSQHLPAFLSGHPAVPSRCCSTFPREAARTASRSRAKPFAAPPVRR